jgi:hypothetical protein
MVSHTSGVMARPVSPTGVFLAAPTLTLPREGGADADARDQRGTTAKRRFHHRNTLLESNKEEIGI